MADYVYIKNNSKDGEIALSRRVFEDLAVDATNRVLGASVSKNKSKNKLLDKLYQPVKVTFHKNGQVEIKVTITMKKGLNAEKVCLAIQEEIAQSLLAYAESVPFEIQIKIAAIS